MSLKKPYGDISERCQFALDLYCATFEKQWPILNLEEEPVDEDALIKMICQCVIENKSAYKMGFYDPSKFPMPDNISDEEKEFLIALDNYEKTFEEGYPTIPMCRSRSKKENTKIIYECIEKHKTPEELGYYSTMDKDGNIIYI